MENIVIPDSVINIGNYVFYDCTSLKTITIPLSVKSIGDYTFGNCSSLTTVNYLGIEKRWQNMSISEKGNDYFTNANLVLSNTIDMPNAKSSLSEYTWLEIRNLSDALAANKITTNDLSSTYHIEIGSTKTATIKGEMHTFRIVGFSHDIDKNGNTLGMTFEQVDLMNNWYDMKSNDSSTDGWSNSDLITTINNFEVESELNNVIIPAKKPSVTSVSDSTLTYVTSKLWIMSETELRGKASNTYGKTVEGSQYAYYVINSEQSDRIKQNKISDNSYWLRSASYWDDKYELSGFVYITDTGYVSSYENSYNNVSVCFCI